MAIFAYDWGRTAGPGAEKSEPQNPFAWGTRALALVFGATIDGATRDAAASPTSVLRVGLLLGVVTSSKKWKQYDPTATDGTQVARGILATPALRTVDIDGSNQDKAAAVIVGGPVVASKLYNLDALARAHMYNRFIFDDDLAGNMFGWRQVIAKTANYTVTAADNGTIFTNQGAAGAVNFTLPTIARGLKFRFFVEADQNLTITAAAADTLVVFNDAAADSIAFSTASEKIGGCFEVIANADATKWLVFVMLGAETQTPTIAT